MDSHSYFYLSSKALELELLFVINNDIVVIEKGVIRTIPWSMYNVAL